MPKKLFVLLFFSVIALSALIVSIQMASSQTKGSKIKDVTFKAINQNKTIRLSSLKGKVVFVNFFTTWCPSCKQEIPNLEGVYRKLNPKGVEVLGVSLDDKPAEKVLDFVKKMEISYPVALPDKEFMEGFGMVTMIPTTFVIGPSGEIVERLVGPYPQEKLEGLAIRIIQGENQNAG
jgi:peroxiredoxin